MSAPRMKSFRTDLFSPDNITSVEDVQNALFELQSIFTEQNYEHVLDELLQAPFLVELVLSDLSILSVKTWLLEKFPTSPTSFISSVTCQLLLKLATFFVFPPVSFSQEILDLMREFHTTVRHAPAALHDLFAMSFVDEGQHKEAKELSISSEGRSKSRWRSKDGEKAAIRQIIVDPEPLAALALTIPNTSQERDHTTSHLLVHLKTILEIYLENISLPAISQHLKEALIPKEQLPALNTVTDLATSRDVSISAKIAVTDSAYLQSLKTFAPSPVRQTTPLTLHCSARYFDSVVGFGEWVVYISTAADSHLRQFRRKDKKIFEIIVKKIRELSNGRFSDDNQKRLSGPTTQVPIFEAKMQQCKYRRRPHVAGDNVYSPASWPLSEDAEATHDVSVPDLPPDELSQVHSTFVLEKFITFSKACLRISMCLSHLKSPSIVAQQLNEYENRPRERAVIEYPFSCYVLGRSGTGKTTTMLFKMLWVERAYQSSTEGAIKPRQVFVTKSRLLATKVGDYFEKLSNSLATGSCSPQELKLLAKSRQIQIRPQRHLVAWNDIPDWRSDLPSKYSDLEDRHFPLFITFDQLCSMLETSQIEQYNNDAAELSQRSHNNEQLSTTSFFTTVGKRPSWVITMRPKGLSQYGVPGRKLDRLYVDEAQDNLLVDALQSSQPQQSTTVLRSLCRNPNGLFWAGDTAQAISIGSSFRINDLKAFLYRVERSFQETSEAEIELGAHQCVLVRDEVARERLRSQVGSIGIILTLYESKGLEFNDWRVILNAVDVSVPVPDFDEMRHAPICSELKFLYVAITRARNNLWIVDSSSKADPMKVFWTCHDLVNDSVSEFRFTDLAVESTPEDWEIRAKDFFDQEQFAQARYAYKKGLLHHAADVANAYELREIARSRSTGPPRAVFEHRMKAFAKASRAFLSCAKEAIHAPEDYYRAAAECFENAGDGPHGALTYLPEAARAYLLAKCFTNAAQLFRKAAMFDEAIDVITKHPEKVEKSVVKQIKEAARLKYFTVKEFEKAHKLFDSIEEELEYLSERNFYEAQVELLVSLGRVADAAELHLLEGHIIEALELFLEDKGDPSQYTQRVIHCILQGLWREFSLGSKKSSTDVVVKLFRYADSIDPSLLSPNEHDEMELFKAISSRTFKNLVSLADAFFERQNMSAALLSLDYHFSEPQAWQNMDLVSLTTTLRPFSLYVQQLHDMAFYADPRTNGHIWKMFGLRPHGHAAFVVPHGTFLHKKATSATASTMEGSRDAIVLIKKLLRIVRNALSERLLERVTSQNEMFRRAKALFPCPLHVLGNCVKSDQCTEDHIEPNHVWYNTWIQAHIYQFFFPRFWIGKLYDALLDDPPAYKFGTISSLKQELSGGFEAGFQIIIAWIRELADNLEFSSHMETQLLTQVMQTTDLSLTLNGKEAQFYLYRSKLIPPQYLRKPKDYNSLLDLLSSYQNSKPWSVLVGTLFIKQIMQNRLPVEIGVLCTYIEHLCTLAIVANRVQGTGGLHDVTLPCSWLSKALANFSLGEAADKTINFWLFPPILGDFIKYIYTAIGSEHLLFGPELRPLTKEELPIRNMFIARLYRVLVLLGYNIRVMAFRSQIWRVSNAMHGFGQPPFSPLYKRYVGARDWWEISSAVRESMQGLALDEMVNLQHAARIALPIQEHRGLRRIVYSVVEDIPALLQSGFEVPLSISESQELTSDVVSEPLNEGSKDDISDPVDNDVHEDPTEHDADPLNLGYKLVSEPLNEGREDDIADPIYGIHEHPTEYETDHSIVIEDISQQVEELHAACILQRAFRRCLTRQKEREEDRLSGRCRHFFAICLDVVKKDKWERSRYKFYFLGPLPHVLACLDAAQVAVLAKKEETKKLLRGGDIKNEAWDDLNSQLTLIVNAHKGVKRMLKTLEPTAEVHRRHDLTSLKVHISQAVNLLRTFPFKGSEDPQLYLDIAYKSMREPVRKSAKKEKKPQLNLDDEDLMHLDYA
ncbi:uncharacterized protein LACBIDRAFT_294434 [Laccaria bicolor S238N-H82]|uniref:Predicted protein n=1 Tax=Laccaria bicolor (strain S238N-H82 / ATCC MYA-4686) TaxID=486041 RepID=B0DB28_LACBS|nr:uncharacterized protein LACBIDRAFT_294434 [Laccaria bicolor S238N-H82]EDR08129.1 predicted protein [Laccaria bicolor S238N-H82]|eukprot:XP_001881199.1 predicted protein [Laccaria bicolor S238N-H82]